MLRLPLASLALATMLTAAAPAAETPSSPQRPERTGFMLADVDGDGRVTLGELETFLHARFSVLDADSDGRISIDQLKQVNGGAPRGPCTAGAFRGPPPGGPGGPGGRPPGPPPGNGARPESPPPGMSDNFPFPQPEDSDEDGFISRAEFVAPARAMIDYWDRNRDGAVTADEAPPATRQTSER